MIPNVAKTEPRKRYSAVGVTFPTICKRSSIARHNSWRASSTRCQPWRSVCTFVCDFPTDPRNHFNSIKDIFFNFLNATLLPFLSLDRDFVFVDRQYATDECIVVIFTQKVSGHNCFDREVYASGDDARRWLPCLFHGAMKEEYHHLSLSDQNRMSPHVPKYRGIEQMTVFVNVRLSQWDPCSGSRSVEGPPSL